MSKSNTHRAKTPGVRPDCCESDERPVSDPDDTSKRSFHPYRPDANCSSRTTTISTRRLFALVARGFAGPKLRAGESKKVPILRSLERSRLIHVDVDWQEGTAARGESSSTIQVPAGEFTVDRYTLTLPAAKARKLYPPSSEGRGRPSGGRTSLPPRVWTIEVETEFPHRVVRWSRDDGLKAEMVGKTRMPYWGMNRNGYESALEEIGLKPRPPRTP